MQDYKIILYDILLYGSTVELNECDPNPCLNSGTCVDGVRNYTCNCTSFPEDGVLIYFTGRNCSTGEKGIIIVKSINAKMSQFLVQYSTVVDNRVAPSVTMQTSSVTVELGERISLRCTAAGNPTPSIQWYKDNKPIKGPQAIGNVFVIPEATPDKRGSYLCEAFSSFGSPARSAKAEVLIQG